MKKSQHELKLDTGPVKLYREDIKAIVEVLRQLPDTGKIKIGISEYELTDISELEQINQKVTNSIDIEYTNNSPYMRVSFCIKKEYSHLTCNEDTLLLQGIFSKIEKILLTRRRKWQWVGTLFWIMMSLGTLNSIIILYGKSYKILAFTYIGVSILIIFFVSILLFLITKPVRRSEIILVEKNKIPSFWTKNKDAIVVTIITNFVSLIIGVILTLIVQKITK